MMSTYELSQTYLIVLYILAYTPGLDRVDNVQITNYDITIFKTACTYK